LKKALRIEGNGEASGVGSKMAGVLLDLAKKRGGGRGGCGGGKKRGIPGPKKGGEREVLVSLLKGKGPGSAWRAKDEKA